MATTAGSLAPLISHRAVTRMSLTIIILIFREHGAVDDPLGYVALRTPAPPKALTPDQIKSYDEVGYVHTPEWGCRAGSVVSTQAIPPNFPGIVRNFVFALTDCLRV